MKNVNVLLAVVLCAGLCVLFRLFNRSADDSLGWSPNEMYMQSMSGEGASFTSANMSGGNVSNDGVAVSMRSGSFSLRTRARHASMPVAAPQASSLSLSGSTSTSSSGSLIGHMTSSAEYHSFGGGHSGNMGSAMTGMTNSGNVAASFAYSSPSYGVASSGLSSYSPITLLSGTDGTQVMSAEQALISASNSASGLFGSALQNTYGTATYGETTYGSYGSTPRGVRGRQNAGPWESWLKWLSEHEGLGNDGISGTEDDGYWGTWIEGEGGSYTITYSEEQLRKAYEAWVNSQPLGSLTPGLPSFEAWWEWMLSGQYDGYGYNGNTYRWVPVGNIFPLLILALMYAAYVVVRRRKSLAEQA